MLTFTITPGSLMFIKDTVFIGIDPSCGEDSLTYTVLDKDLHILALSQQKLNTVSAFVGGQKSAVALANIWLVAVTQSARLKL